MLEQYLESGRRIPQWAPTFPSWGYFINNKKIQLEHLPQSPVEGHEVQWPSLTRWKTRSWAGCLLSTLDLPLARSRTLQFVIKWIAKSRVHYSTVARALKDLKT